MCASLISSIARYPVAIVSGLALGIDTEAHRAALDAGVPTVAVLPSSTDERSIYPAANHALAERILKSGGALVSEQKGPYKAHPFDFPARNRIMAGLCKATLVIEAGERSGTLITARLALEYNREVMGIPHDLERETGRGVNLLLRQGATLIRNAEDLLESLGFAAVPEQRLLPADLTDTEAALLDSLEVPRIKDELIERAALSAEEANVALSSLLIRGLIVERLGKFERA